jgi:dihydrofolate synthase / folylpolyglutamate synthase
MVADYDKVTKYILSLRKFGEIELRLDRIQYLLNMLGNPEKKLKYVHIGGTNGKGSTAAMVSSILSYAGYKVGTFTSPHLSDFTERIVIKNKKIPKDDLVRLFEELIPVVEQIKTEKTYHITQFEFITAIAIKYFVENQVDIVVMEVGLGGRLDATNVIEPIVSIITNIGLEHTEILGDTREKIALEKAGIIKNDVPLITAADPKIYKIFEDICKKKNSTIYLVGSDIKLKPLSSYEDHQLCDIEGFGKVYQNVSCKLIGEHQLYNIGCAFGAIEILNKNGFTIDENAFRKGLDGVVWPGRLEVVQDKPKIVLDCAKDPVAMKALRDSLPKIFSYDQLILVISISSDKQIELMLADIVPISDLVITTKHNVQGRAVDPQKLADNVLKYNKKTIVTRNVPEAIDVAIKLATPDSLICIAGSVFLVGEARERWHKEAVTWGREMNEGRKIDRPAN